MLPCPVSVYDAIDCFLNSYDGNVYHKILDAGSLGGALEPGSMSDYFNSGLISSRRLRGGEPAPDPQGHTFRISNMYTHCALPLSLSRILETYVWSTKYAFILPYSPYETFPASRFSTSHINYKRLSSARRAEI